MRRHPWHQPPPLPVKNSRARKVGALTTVLLLLAYAGIARIIFATASFELSGGVVAFSFLFGVPCAIGMLSVAIGRWCGSDRWLRDGIGIPWTVVAAAVVICLVFKLEAILCILMGGAHTVRCQSHRSHAGQFPAAHKPQRLPPPRHRDRTVPVSRRLR